MGGNSLKRITRYALWVACCGLIGVTAIPGILYCYGLHLIPEERLAITADLVPESAELTLWASLGGTGTPELIRLNPYSFVFELCSLARCDDFPEPSASERLATLASHVILPRGTHIGGGMGAWHLARASAYIWAGRHWSAQRAIAAFLHAAYFAHGFVGLESAARGYFGVPARDLSQGQLALLMAAAHRPASRDPWCHRDENLAAVREIMQRLSPPVPLLPMSTLPAPQNACRR